MKRSGSVLSWLVLLCVFGGTTFGFAQNISRDAVWNPERLAFTVQMHGDPNLWVYSTATNSLVGYALWDELRRRYSLFAMDRTFEGFMLARIGGPAPLQSVQFLYYDKDGKFLGVFVRTPGGRPRSQLVPMGELGGHLQFFPQ